jgi:hypothetical protein
MKRPADARAADAALPKELARILGVRRAGRLRRLMRQTGLPAEVLLDLALELLDLAARKLSPSPLHRTALGLGTARWRGVTPEERSELLRRAAKARWAKHRSTPGEE